MAALSERAPLSGCLTHYAAMKVDPKATESSPLVSKPTSHVLGEAIAALPFSRFHCAQFVVACLIWAQWGMQMSQEPWLLADARRHFDMDSLQESRLILWLRVGKLLMLVTLVCLGASYGRRPMVMWPLALTAAWCLGIAFAYKPAVLGTMLVAGGPFLGLGAIAAKMLVAEIMPSARRGLLLNSLHVMWQVGALTTAALTLLTTRYTTLSLITVGPTLVCLGAFALVAVESPQYLLDARGDAAATEAFRNIAARAGVSRESVAALPPQAARKSAGCVAGVLDLSLACRELLGPSLLRLTMVTSLLIGCLTCGMSIDLFVVEMLEDVGLEELASAVSVALLISKLCGGLAGALLVDRIGRRPLLGGAFAVVGCAMLALAAVLGSAQTAALAQFLNVSDADATEPHVAVAVGELRARHVAAMATGGEGHVGLYLSVSVLYAAAEVCWSVSDTYVNEVFPTRLRPAANALCRFVGWLLGTVFSVCGPQIMSARGSSWLLRLAACFMFCGGALVLLLKNETAGRPVW